MVAGGDEPADRNRVLITGGGSGIGLAVAGAVLDRGWRAVVTDVSPANLKQARAVLAGSAPLAEFAFLDVTDEDAVVALMAECEGETGPLTGVVNSAGVASDVHCLDTSTDLFRRLLEINLIGAFVVAREAARQMRRHGRGSIVNIASVSGILGNTGRVAYGASKAGLIAATQVMAAELASSGVRVNAVAPGGIETPLARELHTPSFRAEWARRSPQGRYGSPAEVAAVALFLLDDRQSSYITGQTLCVDGGFTTAGLTPERG